MKTLLLAFVICLRVALIASEAAEARFERGRPRAAKGAVTTAAHAPGAEAVTKEFTPVELTNRIAPEWLLPATNLYRLGPGDVIEIELFEEQISRSSAVVGPDGKIYYSILPGTMVWGMTLTETRQTLEDGLKKYLRTAPDITVNLKFVGSKTVWVLGNVQMPGVYLLNTPRTVLEAITLAGGTLVVPGAPDGIVDLKRSFLMRDGKLLPVDIDGLLRNGDLAQNVYLEPDDLLYLRSGITRNIYVLGAVGLPMVVPYTDRMTLMAAIATTGGTVPYAYLSQVTIIRGSLTNPQIAVVDFKAIMRGKAADINLEPGDIVHIPFVPWKKVALVVEGILNQFVRSVAVNEGYRSVYPNAGPVTPSIPFGNTYSP
jgi:protein involved in polysaccharide export with SLBB domain